MEVVEVHPLNAWGLTMIESVVAELRVVVFSDMVCTHQ